MFSLFKPILKYFYHLYIHTNNPIGANMLSPMGFSTFLRRMRRIIQKFRVGRKNRLGFCPVSRVTISASVLVSGRVRIHWSLHSMCRNAAGSGSCIISFETVKRKSSQPEGGDSETNFARCIRINISAFLHVVAGADSRA